MVEKVQNFDTFNQIFNLSSQVIILYYYATSFKLISPKQSITIVRTVFFVRKLKKV